MITNIEYKVACAPIHPLLTGRADTLAMQIGSGQAPLSLAMLKALGGQAAATAAPAAKAPAAPAAPGAAERPGAATTGEPAAARTLPRGSFVDLRV